MAVDTHPVSDERYRIAYDAAVRRVEAQGRDLDEMRTRAAAILTVGVAITAFLGGFVLNRGSINAGGILGIVLFFGVGVALGIVLWPREWKFHQSAAAMVGEWIDNDPGGDVGRMYRDLALHLDQDAEANATQISWRWTVFEVALALLAADTITWLVVLALK